MTSRLSRHAVVLIALMCMASALHEARADLLISGPVVGTPNQELTFDVVLNASLSGAVDDLTLTLDFDHALLSGTDAVAGALLAGALFTPNAAGGTAVASFSGTQAGLGPGVLATWKFKINSSAHGSAIITPHLQTSIIDSQLTEVPGNPFAMQLVPEPSLNLLLVAGLALIACARGISRKQ